MAVIKLLKRLFCNHKDTAKPFSQTGLWSKGKMKVKCRRCGRIKVTRIPKQIRERFNI